MPASLHLTLSLSSMAPLQLIKSAIALPVLFPMALTELFGFRSRMPKVCGPLMLTAESLILRMWPRLANNTVLSLDTTYVWQSVFGSQGAGSKILSATPVWYFNDNAVQSFDDFSYAGFGTWDEPSMKNYARNVYLCYLSFASYEYYEK